MIPTFPATDAAAATTDAFPIEEEQTVEFDESKNTVKVTKGNNIRIYSKADWDELQKPNPNRHIQRELEIGVFRPDEKETNRLSDKYFAPHKEEEISIKVVYGMICGEDNILSDDNDLFYHATFVPVLESSNVYLLIIQTGFDVNYEKTTVRAYYTKSTGTVVYSENYRMAHCPEEYEKFKHKIIYSKDERIENSKDAIPWIRFPRTKDGVSIPYLMDRILQGNFNEIHFHN